MSTTTAISDETAVEIDGARLFVRRSGAGEPLVLVHGSWTDSDSWQLVTPILARDFDVTSYDRRGHSRSERGWGPVTRRRDEDDLAALIEHLGSGPVHLVANSFGGAIALSLAVRRPELVRGVAVHEPPLLAVLARIAPEVAGEVRHTLDEVVAEIRVGDHEQAAKWFIEEVALGPGSWALLPDEVRAVFVANARCFLDLADDPAATDIDVDGLGRSEVPVLLTDGGLSVPWFSPIVDQLAAAMPSAARHTFVGAGHAPHLTHADEHAATVGRFLTSA